MRSSRGLVLAVALAAHGCGGGQPVGGVTTAPLPSATSTASAVAAAVPEVLAADTPRTTAKGATFIAPAGWSIVVRGPATILEAPEPGSRIALVDVEAKDADEAVAAAWAAYDPTSKRPLLSATERADIDGWQGQRVYVYRTSPEEKRSVTAGAAKANDVWTVWIYDVSRAIGEKRGAQISLIFGRLFPKGFARENFAGKKASPLDAARIRELSTFIEGAQKSLGIPGVAIGLIQDDKTVFAGGFGVRELGKNGKVGADTLFMIASNTKAMTTLLLGKLVDEKKIGWDTPVTSLLEGFKLGDADTTSRVQVKHLVCACTGLPRQDLEWLLEFKTATPDTALSVLGTMQPTSKFGEMFQYSNPLAAAGGWVGARVAVPKRELGAAYDEAMRTMVFAPLGMNKTTFDFKRALASDHAAAHALDIDGEASLAVMGANYAIVPVRPAGGAWSTVNDVLKYVAMELDRGMLPNGKRLVSEDVIEARRAPQVTIGRDATYGMGLEVDTTYGTPVVHHGGSMIGYKSDMMWLPEHGVGAVILTNADTGGTLLWPFRKKLLELLFDGRKEADAVVAARAKAIRENVAANRKLLTVPPAGDAVAALAPKYESSALGGIVVTRAADSVSFDFGEWKTPVATKKHPDGSTSFITITPGMNGLELIPGTKDGKRTLVMRDSQHEYVFVEE